MYDLRLSNRRQKDLLIWMNNHTPGSNVQAEGDCLVFLHPCLHLCTLMYMVETLTVNNDACGGDESDVTDGSEKEKNAQMERQGNGRTVHTENEASLLISLTPFYVPWYTWVYVVWYSPPGNLDYK